MLYRLVAEILLLGLVDLPSGISATSFAANSDLREIPEELFENQDHLLHRAQWALQCMRIRRGPIVKQNWKALMGRDETRGLIKIDRLRAYALRSISHAQSRHGYEAYSRDTAALVRHNLGYVISIAKTIDNGRRRARTPERLASALAKTRQARACHAIVILFAGPGLAVSFCWFYCRRYQ